MILGASTFLVVFPVLSFLVVGALLWLKADKATIVLFLLALAISSWRFVTTSPLDFTNDIGGHRAYIDHVTNTYSLPKPPFGWQSQQPPLFYISAAIGQQAAKALSVEPIHGARFVSALFYFGFAIVSALILRYAVRRQSIYILSLALVLFWPASAHTSVKTNNDIPEAFFCILTFYFCLRWLAKLQPRLLAGALVAAGMAIATKGSGLVAIAMLGLTAAIQLWRRQLAWRSIHNRWVYLGLAVLALGLSVNFGRTAYWKMNSHPEVKFIINRDEHYAGFYDHVTNDLRNYWYFSPSEFFGKPFAPLEKHEPGAHLFWNVFLKTLLLDVHVFSAPALAKGLSVLFVVFLGSCVFLSVRSVAADNNWELPLAWGSIALTLVMVMAARILVPVSNQASARYVYYVVTLLVLIYGVSLEKFLSRRRNSAKYLALAPGCLMVLFSVSYILAQFE